MPSESAPEKKRVVVLGQALADARSREAERLATDPLASPLATLKYDALGNDHELIAPVESATDRSIADFCDDFAAATAEQRSILRSRLSLDDFYTLVTFAKRSAVFGLREESRQRIWMGLCAVAVIDPSRIDPRDVGWALGILHYCCKGPADTLELFNRAASLAEPEIAKTMVGFSDRTKPTDLARSWGYSEIETEAGRGLVSTGIRSYNPSYDLFRVATQIVSVLRADGYVGCEATIAADLPAVWLKSPSPEKLDRALKNVVAGAKARGQLPPGVDGRFTQDLYAFVVELNDRQFVDDLIELSSQVVERRECILGLRADRLFCLVVARSFVQGVANRETPQTIQRFAEPTQRILEQEAFRA